MKTDLENEIWKDVVGYEGSYMISNLGRLYCMPKSWDISNGGSRVMDGRIASIKVNRNTYYYAFLCRNSKTVHEYIHRLVVKAFIGDIPKGMVVNHIDHNKQNNHVDNLEICTIYENAHKAIALERRNLKFCKDDLIEIFKLLNEGMPQRKIAARFNVSQRQIHKIKHNELMCYVRKMG